MFQALIKFLFRTVETLTKQLAKAQGEIAELRKDSKATFRVSAIRDSKTCPICKMMDKRRVELPTRNGFVAYGDLKKGSGWGKENLIPPYHPNCRCVLKPVFGK